MPTITPLIRQTIESRICRSAGTLDRAASHEHPTRSCDANDHATRDGWSSQGFVGLLDPRSCVIDATPAQTIRSQADGCGVRGESDTRFGAETLAAGGGVLRELGDVPRSIGAGRVKKPPSIESLPSSWTRRDASWFDYPVCRPRRSRPIRFGAAARGGARTLGLLYALPERSLHWQTFAPTDVAGHHGITRTQPKAAQVHALPDP